MNKELLKYIKNGIIVKGNPNDGYTVFTPATQEFRISLLEQLTPELFERKKFEHVNFLDFQDKVFKTAMRKQRHDQIRRILNAIKSFRTRNPLRRSIYIPFPKDLDSEIIRFLIRIGYDVTYMERDQSGHYLYYISFFKKKFNLL